MAKALLYNKQLKTFCAKPYDGTPHQHGSGYNSTKTCEAPHQRCYGDDNVQIPKGRIQNHEDTG